MKFLPIDVAYMRELFIYAPDIGGSYVVRKINRLSGRGRKIQAKAGTVAGWRSYKDGYWYIVVDGKRYVAHRIVWALVHGVDPTYQIDHINGVRDDNRIENLRLAPKGQLDNLQNSALQSNNTSGYRGVSWHKIVGKWQGRIVKNQKTTHLGYFDTPEEAYAAYLKAKKELHEFQPVPRDIEVNGVGRARG